MNYRTCLVSLLLAVPCLGFAASPEFLDVHAHFQVIPDPNLRGSANTAMNLMERFGIRKTLIMPNPFDDLAMKGFYDVEELKFLVTEHPDRFAIIGGSTLNTMLHSVDANKVDEEMKAKFRARAEKIADLGAVGFGEIAILHLSLPAMGTMHHFQNVPATHPLLLLLADVAAERGIPIDVHFDMVPEDMPLPEKLHANRSNPDTLRENLAAFKELLRHNPKTTIVWSHVGFEPLLTRTPQVVRELLREFPNLYMSFRLNRVNVKPAAAFGPNGELKKPWKELISEFPDRFMLGSDAFYAPDGTIARGSDEQGMNNFHRLLEALPEPAQAALAYQNAERIYHLDKAPAQ